MKTFLISRLTGLNHTNEEIPFDWMALLTRGIIVMQRKLYGNNKGRGACSTVPNPLSYRDSVDFIRAGILSGKPFMAGKIGTGDNETMLRYMDIHDRESALVKAMKLFTGQRSTRALELAEPGQAICGIFGQILLTILPKYVSHPKSF